MMESDMSDRLDALERHALVVTDALTLTLSHVAALTAVNAALIASLDPLDRSAIREAAITAIGEGPQRDQVCGLIEALTQEPAAAVADHHVSKPATVSDLPGRLQ